MCDFCLEKSDPNTHHEMISVIMSIGNIGNKYPFSIESRIPPASRTLQNVQRLLKSIHFIILFYLLNIFISLSLFSTVPSISSRSRRNIFPFCARIESTSLSLYSRRFVKSSIFMMAYFTFFPKKVFSRKLLNSILSSSPMMNISTILFVVSFRKSRIASEIVTRSRFFRHLKNSFIGIITLYDFRYISRICSYIRQLLFIV